MEFQNGIKKIVDLTEIKLYVEQNFTKMYTPETEATCQTVILADLNNYTGILPMEEKEWDSRKNKKAEGKK